MIVCRLRSYYRWCNYFATIFCGTRFYILIGFCHDNNANTTADLDDDELPSLVYRSKKITVLVYSTWITSNCPISHNWPKIDQCYYTFRQISVNQTVLCKTQVLKATLFFLINDVRRAITFDITFLFTVGLHPGQSSLIPGLCDAGPGAWCSCLSAAIDADFCAVFDICKWITGYVSIMHTAHRLVP